jgi:hypothetical protein
MGARTSPSVSVPAEQHVDLLQPGADAEHRPPRLDHPSREAECNLESRTHAKRFAGLAVVSE